MKTNCTRCGVIRTAIKRGSWITTCRKCREEVKIYKKENEAISQFKGQIQRDNVIY